MPPRDFEICADGVARPQIGARDPVTHQLAVSFLI